MWCNGEGEQVALRTRACRCLRNVSHWAPLHTPCQAANSIPLFAASLFICRAYICFFSINRGLHRRPISAKMDSTSCISVFIVTMVSAVPTSSRYRVLNPNRVAVSKKYQQYSSQQAAYPTRARSFSLLLAISRRNSCSTRRTVGIGYWKASAHDLRLWGSGASGAIVNDVVKRCSRVRRPSGPIGLASCLRYESAYVIYPYRLIGP